MCQVLHLAQSPSPLGSPSLSLLTPLMSSVSLTLYMHKIGSSSIMRGPQCTCSVATEKVIIIQFWLQLQLHLLWWVKLLGNFLEDRLAKSLLGKCDRELCRAEGQKFHSADSSSRGVFTSQRTVVHRLCHFLVLAYKREKEEEKSPCWLSCHRNMGWQFPLSWLPAWREMGVLSLFSSVSRDSRVLFYCSKW